MSAATIFSNKPLSEEHKTELKRTGVLITIWTNAYKSNQDVDRQTERLAAFEVAEQFSFKPSPSSKMQGVLLSMTRCYWLGVVNSLTAQERSQLTGYLNGMPSFRGQPMFDGRRVVDHAGDLTATEYERLLRTVIFVLAMMNDAMAEWWRQLAEMGAAAWPEEEEEEEEYDEDEIEEVDEDEDEDEWEDMKA